jgi:Protein of unknown function (DUF2911)
MLWTRLRKFRLREQEETLNNRKPILLGLGLVLLAAASGLAQDQKKPPSPRGTAATQVGGKRATAKAGEEPRYSGGKWIEVDYGRPILRGRKSIFGSGADYGKAVNSGAPVWRTGANQTTMLTTEVPIVIGGKTLAPGTYDLFVDLKESGWTLIVSTQPTQAKYDPKDKTAIWGSFGYDPKFDVVRVPMTMAKLAHSVDQFTIAFVDMSDAGGRLAMAWDTTAAIADFTISK